MFLLQQSYLRSGKEVLGSNGPLMKVKWLDATNATQQKKIDTKDPSNHLSYCETIGEVVAQCERAIVISYHYSDIDGVDFICIPTSWVVEMEELCPKDSESSVSRKE